MGRLIIRRDPYSPPLLFHARITNIYIVLMPITTVRLGAIGFIDDLHQGLQEGQAWTCWQIWRDRAIGIGSSLASRCMRTPLSARVEVTPDVAQRVESGSVRTWQDVSGRYALCSTGKCPTPRYRS
ncbi:MAG: hypothetical protein IPI55_04505 [Flavobacteriales bacterium]|nr:hypothetical protein [Flavobacteriales bacterium]